MGVTEGGYTLGIVTHGEEISESDAYGQSLIEIIYRGATYTLTLNSLEYKAGSIAGFSFFGTLGTLGTPMGRLGSALAGAVVLTSTASTPAASTPASLSATRAILAPGYNVDLLFNSKLRRVPLQLRLLPSDAGTNFTTA